MVAIAGGTGSGKTSVAKALRRAIGDEFISFVSHDSYYKDLSHLPMAERALCNFDHPNSLDTSTTWSADQSHQTFQVVRRLGTDERRLDERNISCFSVAATA